MQPNCRLISFQITSNVSIQKCSLPPGPCCVSKAPAEEQARDRLCWLCVRVSHLHPFSLALSMEATFVRQFGSLLLCLLTKKLKMRLTITEAHCFQEDSMCFALGGCSQEGGSLCGQQPCVCRDLLSTKGLPMQGAGRQEAPCQQVFLT